MKRVVLAVCCLSVCCSIALVSPGWGQGNELQANLDQWQVGYEIYQVQNGDTVENIAARFGVPAGRLRAVNRLSEESRLAPGQSLAIILPGRPRPPKEEATESVTVEASTDSVFEIRYAKIVKACSITSLRPPASGRVLWQCDPDDRVLVSAEQDGYYGVIMLGGSMGWIPIASAQLTDESVSQEALNQLLQNGEGHGEVVQEAMRYLGTPYRYGGHLPRNVDCSLLVQTVFARYGMRLPRTAAEQCDVGQPVSTANLQAGDRLYFIDRHGRIGHTAIYIGNSQFIHASANRGCVAIDSLNTPYYSSRFYGARRL